MPLSTDKRNTLIGMKGITRHLLWARYWSCKCFMTAIGFASTADSKKFLMVATSVMKQSSTKHPLLAKVCFPEVCLDLVNEHNILLNY